MPPRFVYWTILIDNKPTAFRAHDRDDLLPTVTQLRRTNKDVVIKYFARGRVWDSPEQAREHFSAQRVEKRGRDWRPGGSHEDPRARFDPKKKKEREAARSARSTWSPSKPPAARPWQKERPRSDRPIGNRPESRPGGSRPSRIDRPDAERRPWQDKARDSGERKDTARPWSPKPSASRPPWKAAKNEKRPWQRKPSAPSTGGSARRPWHKPPNAKKPKPPEDE